MVIIIEKLIEQCHKHLETNGIYCEDCPVWEKCQLFKEFYGTTPYLMHIPHIAKKYDFDYKSTKDFVI